MWWSTSISPNSGRRTSIALADLVSKVLFWSPLWDQVMLHLALAKQWLWKGSSINDTRLLSPQADLDTWVWPLTWSLMMTALTWKVLKNSWVLKSSLFPAVLTRVYMWPSTIVRVGRRLNCEQERWVQRSLTQQLSVSLNVWFNSLFFFYPLQITNLLSPIPTFFFFPYCV